MAPALAVANALRAEGAEVCFIGGDRAEAQLVPRAGYPLWMLSVEGLSRTNPVRAARALALAGLAVPRARGLLRELRADAVLGVEGTSPGPSAWRRSAWGSRSFSPRRTAIWGSPTACSRGARGACAWPSRPPGARTWDGSPAITIDREASGVTA